MENKKTTINIYSKLGGNFLKGYSRKPSFISMARSINLSINFYKKNDPTQLDKYINLINEIIVLHEDFVVDLNKKLKEKVVGFNINEIDTAIIDFDISDPLIIRVLRIGMLADSILSMLLIYRTEFFIERTIISTKYQKPLIERLKECLAELVKTESESRENRKGGNL